MLNFREWLLINETKEEKALAAELAGSPSVVTALSEVIPQKDKNADKLLLLAAYYYSLTKDKEQVKTDMTDYIGYLNKNKMELITVNLVSKKPPPPWDNYIYWTEIIHGHQADDADKEKSKFKPSEDDFQGEKPFMTSPDGKIKVYEANSPQQCIILGRGQTFCISQPGNKMWQTYRDNQTSTFYFVYDNTRDDRLGIVVIDVTENRIVLTDKPNSTGTTLDPYTGQLTYDSNSYMKYLKEKGIDTSKLVNIPKNPKEKEEDEKLGEAKKDLNWFIALSPDYKSKYIGRAHLLTDEQFDHLWNNKFTSLLTQYVKTGLYVDDYQIDKIATDSDLKKNYIHNRSIADQHSHDLTKKEYSLFSVKQKESYYNNMNENKKLDKAIKFDDLDFYKYLVDEKGIKIDDDEAVEKATATGNLEFVEYLVEKGAKIGYNAVKKATATGNLELVEYLVEKGAKIGDDAVEKAAYSGKLDIVTYLVEKGAKIGYNAVKNAARSGNLDIVKYFVNDKNLRINTGIVYDALYAGHLHIIRYLVDEKGEKIPNDAVITAAGYGHLDIVTYLVEEKGLEISSNEIINAARNGHLHIVKYLVGKIEEKGEKIHDVVFFIAIRNNILSLVKYLVEEKGFKVTDTEIEAAETSALFNAQFYDMVDYLKSVRNKK